MTSPAILAQDSPCLCTAYNPLTLNLSSTSTCSQLEELNHSSEIFENKSVLDIACGYGTFSLYANKLGASSVTAVDIQATKVDFFTSVVENHNLPIHVKQIGFHELEPHTNSADIVLFMNQLQLVSDENTSLGDAVYKLAMLTKETLFLKSQWDSISSTANLSQNDQYSLEFVVKELGKYFHHITLVQSHEDYAASGNTNPLLIKADVKRRNAMSMRYMTNVNPLNISLSRGNNPVQLMTSPEGPVVVKKLPPESMLPLMKPEIHQQMFNVLRQSGGPLLAAKPLGDSYIVRNDSDENIMLFPFVGRLANHFPNHTHHAPVQDPLKLAVECRRALIKLPANVIQAVKEHSPPISLKPREDLGDLFNSLIAEKGLSTFIDDVYEGNKLGDNSMEDSVVHNDLQLGNMIADSTGKEWIIDLDILRSGTAYSDFICCAIYNNCSEAVIKKHYFELIEINQRPLLATDMYFAMKILLRWIYELNRHHKLALADLAKPTVDGMATLVSILSDQTSDLSLAS